MSEKPHGILTQIDPPPWHGRPLSTGRISWSIVPNARAFPFMSSNLSKRYIAYIHPVFYSVDVLCIRALLKPAAVRRRIGHYLLDVLIAQLSRSEAVAYMRTNFAIRYRQALLSILACVKIVH